MLGRGAACELSVEAAGQAKLALWGTTGARRSAERRATARAEPFQLGQIGGVQLEIGVTVAELVAGLNQSVGRNLEIAALVACRSLFKGLGPLDVHRCFLS